MNRLILIIFILIGHLTYAQDIDTSFIIKTPKSEIKVECKKTYQNGKLTQSTVMLLSSIHLNQSTINEATNSGIETGKYYVNLHYKSNCDLDSISTLRASQNVSFNNEVVLYFKEFIDAYNRNDLKKYFRESATDCGGTKLNFTYYVE